MNGTIRTEKLPDDWKAATVTPLFKSGDVSDVNCFRPVSVLPTVSKLAERMICDPLVDYLISHDVICPEQHGFRRGHSTESAMLDAVQFIISERNLFYSHFEISYKTLHKKHVTSIKKNWSETWKGSPTARGNPTGNHLPKVGQAQAPGQQGEADRSRLSRRIWGRSSTDRGSTAAFGGNMGS